MYNFSSVKSYFICVLYVFYHKISYFIIRFIVKIIYFLSYFIIFYHILSYDFCKNRVLTTNHFDVIRPLLRLTIFNFYFIFL